MNYSGKLITLHPVVERRPGFHVCKRSRLHVCLLVSMCKLVWVDTPHSTGRSTWTLSEFMTRLRQAKRQSWLTSALTTPGASFSWSFNMYRQDALQSICSYRTGMTATAGSIFITHDPTQPTDIQTQTNPTHKITTIITHDPTQPAHTVKPVFFACTLFREFCDLGDFTQSNWLRIFVRSHKNVRIKAATF